MKSLNEYLSLLKDVKTHYHDTSYNEYYDDIDLNILLECQNKFKNEYNHPEYKIYVNLFEEQNTGFTDSIYCFSIL